MAEIKIEKKKSIWPWIILVLLAIALIWYYFIREPDNRDAIENTTEQVYVQDDVNADMNSDIGKYSAYIGDTDKMGVDHEYSHGALIHLINAVEEKADMLDFDIKADLDEARKNASKITEDPEKLNHADLIKDSGKIITRALTTLQTAKFQNLAPDVTKVDEAVSAIDPAVNTLDQKDKVNNFFKSAESLLQKMK